MRRSPTHASAVAQFHGAVRRGDTTAATGFPDSLRNVRSQSVDRGGGRELACGPRTVYVTDMPRANKTKTGFDRYVQARMRDGDFASAYHEARSEIDAIDRLMRQLDQARARAHLSKADLARRASTPKESVRRLLTKRSNPTLQTVVRLARAVGLQVELTQAQARPSRLAARNEG